VTVVAVVTFPGVAVVGDVGSRSGDGVQRRWYYMAVV